MVAIADLIAIIGADTTGLQAGVAEANGLVNGLAATLGGTLKKAALGGGIAIAGTAVASAKAASDFEAQMNIMKTAVGADEEELEKLREAALLMGNDVTLLGVDAVQSADAITSMAKAGLGTQQIFGDLNGYLAGTTELGGALRAAVDLAAASDLDLAGATDAVVSAMATFGLTEKDATMIADTYVAAADASLAEVSDLTAAMESAGPVMATYGISFQDVNTALAMLADRSILGEKAGTGLRSMFTNLTSTAGPTVKTLANLGIELYDAAGNMKPLPQIIAELGAAMEVGVTRTYEQSAATEEQQKEYTRLMEKIREAQEQLQGYQDGELGASLSTEKLNQRISDLNDKIEDYRTQLEPLQKAASEMVTVQETMTQETRDTAAQQLAGTYGINTLNTLLTEGVTGWEDTQSAMGDAASAQEIAQTRTQGMAGAVEQLGSALQTFMIEVGTPLIENFLTPGVKLLTEWIDGLTDMVPSVEDVSTAFETFKSGLQGVLETIGGVVTAEEPVEAASDVLKPLGESLWDTIFNALTGALDLFEENSDVWGANFGETLGKVLRLAVEAVVTTAKDIGTLLWGAIQDVFNYAVSEEEGAETTKAAALGSALLGFFSSAFTGFMAGLTGDPQWATSFSTWVNTTLLAPFTSLDFKTQAEDMMKDLKDGFDAKVTDVTTAVDNVIAAIKAPFEAFSLGDLAKDIIDGFIGGLVAGLEKIPAWLRPDFVDEWLRDWYEAHSPSKRMADLGKDLMAGLAIGMEQNTYRPALAAGSAARTVNNTYNLQATYGGQMPGNLEGLLLQLLQGMRSRGYAGPLPDMGM